MSRNKKFILGGILFTALVGSLWHFIYDWIGRPEFFWWLFPVSEKVEEHYKLLIYPNLIYGLLMFRFMYRHIRYYWLRLTLGIGLGCVAIRGLFDAYTAVLKNDMLIMDLVIFAVSILVSYAFFLKRS